MDRWIRAEIRAALAWTRRAANRELDFAEALVVRMPAVFSALETGLICRSKAWVFVDLCADLSPEQAEVVCSRLPPPIPATRPRRTTAVLGADGGASARCRLPAGLCTDVSSRARYVQ